MKKITKKIMELMENHDNHDNSSSMVILTTTKGMDFSNGIANGNSLFYCNGPPH